MASLIGETLSLTVNFTNFADTFNDQDLFTTSFTVGAGVEVQNQAVSFTFQGGGFPQTLSGTITVDVDDDDYSVTFNGTQQGGAFSFIFSSVADESAAAITSATETAFSNTPNVGTTFGITPSISTANGGTVTSGFNMLGFQPGSTFNQSVQLVLQDPVSNTAPTASGIPGDVTVTEDAASNFNLSAITFADTDGDNLTVTLAASAGTFTATSGGSVTVGGSNTGTLTLAGTAANINTFLDTAANIQYTGALNVNGNDAATVTVNANDGTVNPLLGTINVDITAVNDAPTASGIPTDVTVTEDMASDFNLSAITFADVEGDSLVVTLTASAGTFTAASGGSVTVGGSNSGTLTLSGTAANINTFLDTAANIQYTGVPNASGNDAATVTVNANDSTVNPLLGTINVDITAVNDAPTASGVPTDVTVSEDTASDFNLSAITFADLDGDNLIVTLAASAGTFTATSGGSVTVGGSNSGTLTLSGTAANINTFLDTASNIQYTGALNVNGNDAATVTVNANDGTVNPLLGTINVDITAVNDAPTASGVPTDVTVTEDIASDFDLSAITFVDLDGDSLAVTLTASAGTFTAASGGMVTVGGSNTGTLTLTGTAANINTFLDTASNIQYTGALNVNGDDAATVTVNANDGTVNPLLGTINVDITSVDDAPTLTAPGQDPTFTEPAAGAGVPAVLFSMADVSTVEAGQNLTSMTLTVTNVTDGGSELLEFNGQSLGLTNGNSENAGNIDGSVSLSGTTATVTFIFVGGESETDFESFINGMAYRHSGDDVTAGPRVVTITALSDNGSTANGGANATMLNLASTVTVVATNDNPGFVGLPANIVVTEDTASNVDLSAVDFIDPDSGANDITLTLSVDAGTLAAVSTMSVTAASSSATSVTLTGTAAQIDTYLNTASNIQYTGALNANGNDVATLTLTANDGGFSGTGGGTDVALGTVNIDITNVDDPGDAADDAFTTDEATAIGTGLNVFNANPTTADTDIDPAPLAVTQVNGVAGNVGTQITLASGALLTLNSDGTFDYDPNGAFNSLAGPASGSSVLSGTDTFTYELNGDDTATVTVTINGVDSDGDVLTGTAGVDILNGGIGADMMTGGTGADRYFVDNAGDQVVEQVGDADFDAVRSSVTVDLTSGNFTGDINAVTLSGSGNVDATGNAINNVLTGNTGNNVLDGQGGTDNLRGRGGDDTYVIDSLGDVVDESLAGSTGTDLVMSSVDVDLTDAARFRGDIERVELSGMADLSVTGNSVANTITGNDGGNTINGLLGSDTLTGGMGNDSFVFNSALSPGDIDTITDFTVGGDMLHLDDAIFGSLVAGALAAGQFYAFGTGGRDNDDFLLYNPTNGRILYDADGLGGATRQVFAVVDPATALSADDFLII